MRRVTNTSTRLWVGTHFPACDSDLAVHIDGWIAPVANTLMVGDPAAPIEGRKGDVVMATSVAAEAVLAALKPGVKVTTWLSEKCKVFAWFAMRPGVLDIAKCVCR